MQSLSWALSAGTQQIYTSTERLMRKKTYWVFFWKGCICQLHTVYKKDCSFIMRFQSCSIYIIHKSLNFSTNYLVELYVSSQMCSSVRSDFDLPPTPPSMRVQSQRDILLWPCEKRASYYPVNVQWVSECYASCCLYVYTRVFPMVAKLLRRRIQVGGKKASDKFSTQFFVFRTIDVIKSDSW